VTAPRPRVRAVLFDLDGVLIDSYEAWFHVVNGAMAVLCAGSVSRPRFASIFGQGIGADLVNLYPGRTRAEVEAIYRVEMAKQAATIHVNPEGRATLDALRARGIRTACVTNTDTDLARVVVRTAGLLDGFDTLEGAREGVREKPAPDLLLGALRTFGLPPDETLMVGDSRYDEEAALAAGVPFLRYELRSGASLAEAIRRRT
jgi:phosphoglycolate phosphatase-like HAD superfamily hydrolase